MDESTATLDLDPTVVTEHTNGSTDPQPKEKYPALELTIPGVRWYLNFIKNKEVFGIAKLRNSLEQWISHKELMESHGEAAQRSINFLNGYKAPRTLADPAQVLQNTVRKYYETLTEDMLRLQCSMFSLDYDSYKTVEATVDALFDAHMQMAQQQAVG